MLSGIPESYLNMTVSQDQGHRREYGVQEGNRQGTGPPKALAWWLLCVPTQANLLCPAGCRPLTFPNPAGQLPNGGCWEMRLMDTGLLALTLASLALRGFPLSQLRTGRTGLGTGAERLPEAEF